MIKLYSLISKVSFLKTGRPQRILTVMIHGRPFPLTPAV